MNSIESETLTIGPLSTRWGMFCGQVVMSPGVIGKLTASASHSARKGAWPSAVRSTHRSIQASET